MHWIKRVLNKNDSKSNYHSFPVKKYGQQKKFLGQGVSCKVYLYEDGTKGDLFAIKSFVKKDFLDEDEIKSVEKEISIHQMVNGNENIVRFLDSFTVKNFKTSLQYFIVLEYLPYSLAKLYKSNGIKKSYIERLCYFKQILNGLLFLQSNNIGHRDIKLDNCCIDANGTIKLIDFGSSTIGNIGYGMAGSPAYAAPEIHNRIKYDSFKCDVWSLGIILINLFYLTSQKWVSARYDDIEFHNYELNPTIENAVKSFNNVIENNEKYSLDKVHTDLLILQLLTVDVQNRVLLENLATENNWLNNIPTSINAHV